MKIITREEANELASNHQKNINKTIELLSDRIRNLSSNGSFSVEHTLDGDLHLNQSSKNKITETYNKLGFGVSWSGANLQIIKITW